MRCLAGDGGAGRKGVGATSVPGALIGRCSGGGGDGPTRPLVCITRQKERVPEHARAAGRIQDIDEPVRAKMGTNPWTDR